MRLRFHFQLGFAPGGSPEGVFCETDHPRRLTAMLAYAGLIGDGNVTRITIGGVQVCPGAA